MTDESMETNGVTSQLEHDALEQLSSGFESFNQVIAANVARAKAIIEEAATAKARAEHEIAILRAAFEQQMAEARAAFEADCQAKLAEIDQQRQQLIAAAEGIVRTNWPTSSVSAPRISATPNAIARPASAAADAPVATTPAELTKTTAIVQGILKPAVATGLQRYLLAQPGVTSVEPREFAEGILRLQLQATVPVGEHLFAGWSDGAGMTFVRRDASTVEIILPSAE